MSFKYDFLTQVRVVYDTGGVVPNAEVFLNGNFKGKTNSYGILFLHEVYTGDTLAARIRLVENATNRRQHEIESSQNWNYRVYHTSVPITYDNNGDGVQFPLFSVTQPTKVQELRLSQNNTLIAFNLLVSIEWDATRGEIGYYRHRLLDLSELLYNSTDGQFLIEHLEITDNSEYWDEADIRIYANLKQSSRANLNGIFGSGGRIKMNPYGAFYPGSLLHEFGHYGFGLGDEYKECNDAWDDSNGPVRCTLASTASPGTPFFGGNGKDSCPMRGARDESLKKWCSGHPDNPHVSGTCQGETDCWSSIANRYSGSFGSRIITPVDRGVLVDRLPDSGVYRGVGTRTPSSADQAESYIPLSSWKPNWHTRSVVRPNECPNLLVRAVFNDSPIDLVRVTLETQEDREIYQGTTSQRSKPRGGNTGPGEIRIRGAHLGDRVVGMKFLDVFPPRLLYGEADIGSCGPDPVEINLLQVPMNFKLRCRPIGKGRISFLLRTEDSKVSKKPTVSLLLDDSEPQILNMVLSKEKGEYVGSLAGLNREHDIKAKVRAMDEEGKSYELTTTVAVHTILEKSTIRAFSSDGQLEIMIPECGKDYPIQLVIEEIMADPHPPLNEGDILLAGPYQVVSSIGNDFQRQVIVSIHLESDSPINSKLDVSHKDLELLHFDEKTCTWNPISWKINEEPLVITGKSEKLGAYAVVKRVFNPKQYEGKNLL